MKIIALLLVLSPAAASADWRSVTAGGVDARLAVPAAPGPRPLFVILHGCAQSNTALEQHGQLGELADAAGVVIALPRVPGGGVLAGCWDYYGAAHQRGARHSGPLLAFTEALLADPDLAIDPARVYLGGLSSGAGQALVTGCLAPDVFAGIAVAGGPGLGTEASAIGGVATTAPAVADLCARLAGPHAAALAGQRAAIVVGDRDFIVAQGYAPVNAEGLATAYGATPAGTAPLDPGEVRLWMDASGPRVALLTVPGLDHAWPGGAGEGPTLEFVARGGLDFAAWSLAFFGGRPGPPVDDQPPTDPPDPPVDPPAEVACPTPAGVVDTLVGHTLRLGVYPGGYGVADATYLELFNAFGVQTPFPLYPGPDDTWYLVADHVPCDEAEAPTDPPAASDPDAAPHPDAAPAGSDADAGAPADAPAGSDAAGGCRATPGGGDLSLFGWLFALGLAWRRLRR